MDRRLILGSAFILCTAGIFGFLTSNRSAPEENVSAPSGEPFFEVWVAESAINKADVIEPVMLKITKVPESEAYKAGVVNKKRFDIPPGALAGVDFETGSIIPENKLLVPGQPGHMSLLLGPDQVPYPIKIEGQIALIDILAPGDEVDVVLIASSDQNLAANPSLNSYRGLTVTPLLKARPVVDVKESKDDGITVVIALSRQEVSQMMIARRIGLLDVYKSSADAMTEMRVGDVLSDFTSVTELRGRERVAN
ncbi:Flp pilus assembly protein CpaB [Endozoicomonas montiporae]|nr:Flp pilus assembly protein CpaB [Endozoicomonas montiporae]AMO55924.1 pilus assembly, Flp-type CpaB [Endozoicomonas montiporae CL-33]